LGRKPILVLDAGFESGRGFPGDGTAHKVVASTAQGDGGTAHTRNGQRFFSEFVKENI
jgi:hypothetical protein